MQRTCIRRNLYQIAREEELNNKGLEGSLLQVGPDMNNAIEMGDQKTCLGRRKPILGHGDQGERLG